MLYFHPCFSAVKELPNCNWNDFSASSAESAPKRKYTFIRLTDKILKMMQEKVLYDAPGFIEVFYCCEIEPDYFLF